MIVLMILLLMVFMLIGFEFFLFILMDCWVVGGDGGGVFLNLIVWLLCFLGSGFEVCVLLLF